ncbi:MAG TPA: RNA polymerase sigma factor [Ktedonobacteraceae bacterium]|jgi:RNA polymerase sigma-70 factor (ECF subfamily)|nr:RNA polymerase sigma factor [Ktedonobacteraceae bacterium]
MPGLTYEAAPHILDEINSELENVAGEQPNLETSDEFSLYTQRVGSIVANTIVPSERDEQQQLVSRALEGDKEAFEEIVHQYAALMLRTASMIVGDRDIAEDAVQDALIQAWQHLPSLREASALRPWLMRIVVNQCISFKRRLARSTAFVRQALSEQATDLAAQIADDHKGLRERDWDIARAIKKLPIKQRAVIILHYYQGMTLLEMSETLQTSENTLKKRIQAALANLRRVLSASDAGESVKNRQSQENDIFTNLQPSSLYV